jgi:GAF domain-containing protein
MSATPDSTLANPEQLIADLQRLLAEREAELAEALEQQTATAEVLGVINSSPGDLAPVFDAMLEKALRLCDAALGMLYRYAGDVMEPLALRGDMLEHADFFQQQVPIDPGSSMERLARGEDLIHIPDVVDTVAYRSGVPGRQLLVEMTGARTVLWVTLRKDNNLLGVFVIYRREVRPFSDKQIALLRNFAAQAVIAMENARLLSETREALEQQTATAEVLQVINSSPGDLAPVFGAILEKAHTLCGAALGSFCLNDGERMPAVATRGFPEEHAALAREGLPTNGPFGKRLARGQITHIPDVTAVAAPLWLRQSPDQTANAIGRVAVEITGSRTYLAVPLRKDGALLGYLSAHRQEVRPFTDNQIALLENFAAQAVIAMENARLITETREALEQQTATAEVLQVINSSPGYLEPVFDAVLENAVRLCDGVNGILWTIDGKGARLAASLNMSPGIVELLRRQGEAGEHPMVQRVIAGEHLFQFDLAEHVAFRSSEVVAAPNLAAVGVRTVIWVAMVKDGVAVGAFVISRNEVRAFTEKQIALLQNFAAQAVIAMENARLINETREALEQQTATAEVLQVINSSPGDLTPVFDALLDKAMHLCGAAFGILWIYDGELFQAAALRGATAEYAHFLTSIQHKPGRDNAHGRLLKGERFVHIANVEADSAYQSGDPMRRATVELGGARTLLAVPLRKEGAFLGNIVIYRRHVQPFSEKQIALLQNFAAQAVIAMENARLITETREALEQQTATAEILQVINSSPGELAPVFDAMLEKAMRLCEAAFGELQVYEDGCLRAVALHGVPPALADFRRGNPVTPAPGTVSGRLVEGMNVVCVDDLKAEEAYRTGAGQRRALVDLGGARSYLAVSLHKDDRLLGAIGVYRQEVRPFSDKQITLLQNFAAQAVIAMDNARLLNEIRQRQAELRVTFDNMGDGVAMFDSELRLAAWNLNFQRILDLPDPLLAERPRVEEFVRYLAAHGEYGAVDVEAEVRRLSERAGTQWSAERTRPDGRVIEVRNNPVPSGGSVLIYSDVTERKRAEAEIRAARDTAEKALQELQAAQASLIHAEKMASLGQLTAGIAHEIKNPLNFVNNFAELSGELLLELTETTAPAVAALGDDERAAVDEIVEMLRGNLDKIAEHGKRADGIVKSMLEHSRGVSGERRVVDLNALIEEALNLAYHGARAQDASFNITLERDLDPAVAPIELAPQEITRVFLNLIGNGFYAATKRARGNGGAAYRPTLQVSTHDLGEAVEVRVRDNGTGIPPEIRDQLFQPFFTTKPTGEGTGLGLSISWDIVTQQHGGSIEVASRPGEFTEFTIRLPRNGQAAGSST